MASAHGLIGRTREWTLAAEAVRALGEGQASVLVIEGETGIGKTRLVRGIVDDARSRGLTVLLGHGHPFERARPFGVLASALDLRRRSPDPGRASVSALLSGEATGSAQTGGLEHRVVEEIVDLVETLCAERPALLVAEDIDWADDASLRAISALVRRLSLSSLLVVVTVRPAPLPSNVARLLSDLSDAGARTLRLGPLGSEDVLALASRELGGAPGPGLTALLAGAGGNPLWVMALLRSLADEGQLSHASGAVEATTAELPASLNDLVVRRLRDLPPGTVELLQVTAVLGNPVSIRDVAAVVGRPPAEVARQLGPAFDAQFLAESDRGVAFRHRLVHDAIYQHIPAPTRRVLHRDAAAALIATGATPLDSADHLMLGAERGDEEAVGWLRLAAHEASPRAPSVAVELLLRVEQLLPAGHPDRDQVSVELVQALLRAGQVTEASTRAEALLSGRLAAESQTPLRLALMSALALQNRAAEVIAVARATLSEPTPLGPAAQVSMMAQLSWALTYSGDPRAGESTARRALEIADQTGSAAMSVSAHTALLVAVGRQGRFGEALVHAGRAVERAVEAPDTRSLPIQPKLFLGLALFGCDRIDEARAAYREALDDSFGSGWWLADTLAADAQACFALGEWEDAVPRLASAAAAAEEKNHHLLLSQALGLQIVLATAAGDLPTATGLSARVAGALEGDELSYNAGLLAVATAGATVAATGDREAAYDLLLRTWRHAGAHDDRFYHRWIAPDLVRLALALDHRDVATEVAEVVEAGVALAPEVLTVQSLALRCRGLVDNAVEPALEAVELARRARLLVDHTGACEDAASVLIRAGRGSEAAAMLAEALERYEASGAEAWASRVRARLRDLGLHPGIRASRHRTATGWESLTATERAVSLLVADGLTNGAVARRLYISPHTVNTHLRHVFAKLAVPNRVALARMVHRPG